MSTTTVYPHLAVDSDGTARISKTRYKVLHLAAEHYHHGWTAEELLRQHPDLRPEQVYSALTFFYDNFDEMVAAMKESAARVEAMRTSFPVSRDELLGRRDSSET